MPVSGLVRKENKNRSQKKYEVAYASKNEQVVKFAAASRMAEEIGYGFQEFTDQMSKKICEGLISGRY